MPTRRGRSFIRSCSRSEEHTSELHSHFHLLYSILFFERSGAPRDLHSFPTRRSSDLRFARGGTCRTAGACRRGEDDLLSDLAQDRKSTRLNSTHTSISYTLFCFLKDPAPPEIYTLSLHDALPI